MEKGFGFIDAKCYDGKFTMTFGSFSEIKKYERKLIDK